MGKGVELTGKNKEKIYPVTASDLVYDKDTKKNIKTSLNEKVEEAPLDGKQYARINGAWGEVEAGAVSETALITLTPAVDGLKGVSVTVTTSEGETVLNTTWQGATLAVQIRAGLQYTVAVGSKDGFITPESVTYTAEKGVSRSINMAYTESKLKVNILSNQSDDTTIAAVKATVTYDSTTVQVANGGEVYLPLNVDVVITFPTVDGYKTPDTITYTHTGGSYEKDGTYQTELVTVNVSADDGTSMDGMVINVSSSSDGVATVDAAGEGDTTYETNLTVSGGKVTFKVPFGVNYYIYASDKDGYATPASQSATASQSFRNFNLVYYARLGTKTPSYGVYIQDVDGYCLTADEWNRSSGLTINGIAVVTENCSFVISLKAYYTYIYETDGVDPPLTARNDLSSAITDFSGQSNTQKLVSTFGTDSDYGINYCNDFVFPNGKKGYMGSAGEWQAAIDNKDALQPILEMLGDQSLIWNYTWTSTYKGDYYFWAISEDFEGFVPRSIMNLGSAYPLTSL